MTDPRVKDVFRRLAGQRDRATDRTFLYLLTFQWLLAIVLAATLTPYTYAGHEELIVIHVKLAVIGGGLLNAIPYILIHQRPGSAATRHAIAAAQMLWSAMLISITGGRPETRSHVFVSLAFLALYRDWKPLLTASTVVIVDHLVWPSGAWWHLLEHGAWIAFEDAVLVVACIRSTRELLATATATVELEDGQALITRKVEARTEALTRTKNRYRTLIENTSALPFEYVLPRWELSYFAPQASRVLGVDVSGDGLFGEAVHAEDREAVAAFMSAANRGDLVNRSCDIRLTDTTGRIVHVRVCLGEPIGSRIAGVAIDITRQVRMANELRQAQKLESVGRLAAGLAHEINTPVQFISDSVSMVRDGVSDLQTVFAAYETCIRRAATEDLPIEEALAALDLATRSDVPYLLNAMPEACERAEYGLGRVTEIVKSVKTFAHPEKSEMSAHDLVAAIDRAVVMARSEYKYVADIAISVDALPRVECRAGEITQVLMNLIIKASHAIQDRMKTDAKRGTISISTRRIGTDRVAIAISDDGCGIPETIRDRLFEPFFTTKELGRGTGQGLAISRAVVEGHHGALTFDTVPGVGTTFCITLPVAQTPRAA